MNRTKSEYPLIEADDPAQLASAEHPAPPAMTLPAPVPLLPPPTSSNEFSLGLIDVVGVINLVRSRFILFIDEEHSLEIPKG
mmetsp:Transcript_21305/g.35150  ORF Transcript_21305/g.35150 Transcript_21305/m.35150 type:complete len:82 (+) Transcript_21305:653-898(+)